MCIRDSARTLACQSSSGTSDTHAANNPSDERTGAKCAGETVEMREPLSRKWHVVVYCWCHSNVSGGFVLYGRSSSSASWLILSIALILILQMKQPASARGKREKVARICSSSSTYSIYSFSRTWSVKLVVSTTSWGLLLSGLNWGLQVRLTRRGSRRNSELRLMMWLCELSLTFRLPKFWETGRLPTAVSSTSLYNIPKRVLLNSGQVSKKEISFNLIWTATSHLKIAHPENRSVGSSYLCISTANNYSQNLRQK